MSSEKRGKKYPMINVPIPVENHDQHSLQGVALS
jgi:hypothetical protein